mmetsp:Transcript_98487/g.205407  ORF Transcript_98487/g.205407 Transcript_98487/m.205407 type:complete len:100 (+) Transcript_98487:154-453(+)
MVGVAVAVAVSVAAAVAAATEMVAARAEEVAMLDLGNRHSGEADRGRHLLKEEGLVRMTSLTEQLDADLNQALASRGGPNPRLEGPPAAQVAHPQPLAP